jgi:hypothetical protein
MAFRFQKRIKILPGVTINLSKSGVSTSVGVPGARITKGHGTTRATMGLPGTGLSHTTIRSDARAVDAPEPPPVQTPARRPSKRLSGAAFAIGRLIGRLFR